MNRQWHGRMRHLGVLRGNGTLRCGGVLLGAARYEIDGFATKPGEVVGSGEISMAPAELADALGRQNLELATDDGRVFALRFSGNRQSGASGAAHADILSGLPAEDDWRR